MARFVKAALTTRRVARRAAGVTVAFVWLLLMLLGVFRDATENLARVMSFGVVFITWFAWRGARRLSRVEDIESKDPNAQTRFKFLDFEFGLLTIVAAHAVVSATQVESSLAQALVYLSLAFVSVTCQRRTSLLVLLVSVAIDLWFSWSNLPEQAPALGLRTAFAIAFYGLHFFVTRIEVERARVESKMQRQKEREKAHLDARLYRLVSSGSDEGREERKAEDKLVMSSVDEVKQSTYFVLDLLRQTLDLQTAVLMLRDDNQVLRIAELSTSSEDIAEGILDSKQGVVGATLTKATPINLSNLKPGYRGLCYYQGPSSVRSVLTVPLIEGNAVRGLLAVDRLVDKAFSPREEKIVRLAAQQAIRAIQNERVFMQLENSKHEHAVLFRASQALGGALNVDQVIEASLTAASSVAEYDFAAVTLFDAETKAHRIQKVFGVQVDGLQDFSFRDGHCLVSMAMRTKHHLPYRGEYEPTQWVFGTKHRFANMQSLLVMPLIVREDPIGTLVIATHRPFAFSSNIRSTLQVLCNQLAVSVSNANAVAKLEEMATTDGLTGCLNKRAFLEDLESKFRSAERFKKSLALLVADIDHFKAVNDTYGHATGDVVIKELGAILRNAKRETDRVARFGGEEFCVLCEETDTAGAKLLAERVRTELQSKVFQTEHGPMRVTCSVGVATFPGEAKKSSDLFEAADKALYAAKHGGRNRVCAASDFKQKSTAGEVRAAG